MRRGSCERESSYLSCPANLMSKFSGSWPLALPLQPLGADDQPVNNLSTTNNNRIPSLLLHHDAKAVVEDEDVTHYYHNKQLISIPAEEDVVYPSSSPLHLFDWACRAEGGGVKEEYQAAAVAGNGGGRGGGIYNNNNDSREMMTIISGSGWGGEDYSTSPPGPRPGNHHHDQHDDDDDVGVSAMKMKMKNKVKMMMKMKKQRRKVREPRFSFKTMTDVDVLDDGYKWRKYGQKVVKNTLHPRSYYRCTQDKCRVKKRVERSAEDARMVITTYEGRHIHSPSNDLDDSHSPGEPSYLNYFFC